MQSIEAVHRSLFKSGRVPYRTRIVTDSESPVHRRLVQIEGGFLEAHDAEAPEGRPVVCAAHPADTYVPGTARLLRRLSGARVVCINPRGLGNSSPGQPDPLDAMVANIDRVRTCLGIEKWVFWGISGGGWLAQLYGREYPDALLGMIIESCCASFRDRVRDPACIMSPRYPAWRATLVRHKLLTQEPDDGLPLDRTDGPPDDETLESVWHPVPGVGLVLGGPGRHASFVLPEGFPDSELMRQAQLAFLKFDSRPWLSDLRMPALILAGTEDPVAPFAHSKMLHERLIHSSLVAVEGAGHNPAVQGQEVAVQAVRSFLQAM